MVEMQDWQAVTGSEDTRRAPPTGCELRTATRPAGALTLAASRLS